MAKTRVLITVKTYPTISTKYEELVCTAGFREDGTWIRTEKQACEAVREKYFDDFVKTKDLHFYLGTSQQFHLVAPNPFMIIGTFHPKKQTQIKLDF